MWYVVVHLLLGLGLLSSGALQLNRTSAEGKKGKVFSLFSIVQFPNEACASTSGTYSNGTCFTSSECQSKGGSAQGNCAAGFGVCCVFSVSATGSTVNQNCSYIVNPNYPSNYAPTSTPNTVSYTIAKCSTDICRVRLDYDQFALDAPTIATTAATGGQCATDRLTMTTTDRTAVPATGAIGTYGHYPYICGTNTGYHSYLDMSCTSTDEATLSFTLGSATTNQWKIKVTQYSCNDPTVASQQGCFQYHTGITGTLQSYNFAGGQQLVGQQYKNCIRQEEGYCCIQYTPVVYKLGAGIADTVQTCANAVANRCSGASLCTSEMISIPGAMSSVSGNGGGLNYDQYCGLFLNALGTPANNQPIVSCECPFELSHITGTTALSGTSEAATVAGNLGFQITYSQIAGNC